MPWLSGCTCVRIIESASLGPRFDPQARLNSQITSPLLPEYLRRIYPSKVQNTQVVASLCKYLSRNSAKVISRCPTQRALAKSAKGTKRKLLGDTDVAVDVYSVTPT